MNVTIDLKRKKVFFDLVFNSERINKNEFQVY